MKKRLPFIAIIKWLYRTKYSAFSRMLMRQMVGDRYIHLENNECFAFIWHYLDSWADGQIQRSLLIHLPPGHFRTTLALTMALHLSGRYPGRRIAYLASDREAVSTLVGLTKHLLSLPRIRFLFPHLTYDKKSDRLLFHEGGSIDFHVFGSPFNAEYVDTIILDEPQRPGDARDDRKAEAAERYVRQVLLSPHKKKPLLLINSLMSMRDIVGAFDIKHPSEQVHQCPLYYDEALQLVCPSVASRPITYVMPKRTWVRPEYHVLCEEVCSFNDQIDIARRIGSVPFITRYLLLPLGKPYPGCPEFPAEVLRTISMAHLLEFVFQMWAQSAKIDEVIDNYLKQYPLAEI